MVIARVQDERVEIIDREKEMIQLARGVNADGHLTASAQKRALACLARFAERLRDIPKDQIRAVGTKTLRSASIRSTSSRPPKRRWACRSTSSPVSRRRAWCTPVSRTR